MPSKRTTTRPLLDVANLCRMFEESESLNSRKDAESSRDNVDGKQSPLKAQLSLAGVA